MAEVGYRSTVVAPAQIALGVASGLLVAVILEALDSRLWPAAVAALIGITVVGGYLATVSLTIDAKRITIGQGRGEREPRVLYVSEVIAHEVRKLTWLQCFGIGIEADDRTTRLTVRPGPTLFLTLVDGEQIRISTADPAAAGQVLDATRERF